MLMPSIFAENLFDDWFDFPSFRDVDRKLYGKRADHEMRTDVHEHEDHYEVDIDLPGFKKEEITISLENGYLTVKAARGLDKDEKDKQGRIIRQERYAGSMQRSFYVGDALTEEDIGAKLEHGVLSLNIPKREARKLPEKRTIAIE
ncbi:MAG: Hsp20/alpha crystallin family protein [Clostridia bacterium]|nr:Hsp20/alpha crystallin family protein [Clostridia bacterium]